MPIFSFSQIFPLAINKKFCAYDVSLRLRDEKFLSELVKQPEEGKRLAVVRLSSFRQFLRFSARHWYQRQKIFLFCGVFTAGSPSRFRLHENHPIPQSRFTCIMGVRRDITIKMVSLPLLLSHFPCMKNVFKCFEQPYKGKHCRGEI